MAKKLTSVLGIDIGSQRIKVCEVKSRGREPEVTALGMIDTPEGAVDHTGIYNPDAVGVALKQVLNDVGATTPYAVVTVAGQASVLVRTLEVPKMNAAELKEHMQWEINRNIPFAESTILSDFKALGDDDPNSPNMDVVMAISPQSAIDTLVSCVKKSGRQTAAIDVEPLSLARALVRSLDEASPQTVCVVEVGAKSTSINIYRAGKLLMPRQVPVGGEMFTSAIADAMGLSLNEAEAMKRERLVIPENAAAAVSPAGGGFGIPGGTQEFQAFNPFSDDVASFNPDATANPYGAPSSPFGGAPEPGNNPFAEPNPFAAPADPYATPADPYATPADPYASPADPYATPADPYATPADPYATPADPYATPGDLSAAQANPFAVAGTPDDSSGVPPVSEPTGGFDAALGAPPAMDATPAVVDADPEATRLFGAISPVLEEFVSEVRRSIDYFRSRGGDVDLLLLCGGGARVRGMQGYVRDSLSVNCEEFNPLQRLSVNMRKVPPAYAEEHRADFALAIGNGLHIFFD